MYLAIESLIARVSGYDSVTHAACTVVNPFGLWVERFLSECSGEAYIELFVSLYRCFAIRYQ